MYTCRIITSNADLLFRQEMLTIIFKYLMEQMLKTVLSRSKIFLRLKN